MIKGLGIDIVETERMKSSILKWGDRFLNKLFHDREIAYCGKRKNMYQCFAARFAAKEAFIKALSGYGAGGKMPALKDIVIMKHPSGKPYIHPGEDLAGRYVINLAISHERHYAVAVVLLETLEK